MADRSSAYSSAVSQAACSAVVLFRVIGIVVSGGFRLALTMLLISSGQIESHDLALGALLDITE